MRMPKIVAAGLALAMLAGCGGAGASSSSSSGDGGSQPAAQSSSSQTEQQGGGDMQNPQPAEAVGPIAVMKTSMGDITIQLYPQEAPKTVENFVALAKSGYYEGVIFHRVIDGFMIQGGDPTGTGRGGESSFGGMFEDEFSEDLLNLRGSLAMANAGPNTNGSQFFINQGSTVDEGFWTAMADNYAVIKDADEAQQEAIVATYGYSFLNTDKITDRYRELYETVGGNPGLDGAYNAFMNPRGHTVFGQVLSGMEVVDAIAAVATDSNDKPVEDVTILSVEIREAG